MGQGEGSGEGQGGGVGGGQGQGRGEGGVWTHGTCGCFSNCGNCVCGTFCFPCLLCNNASRLGESGCFYWLMSCVLPCLPLCLLRGKARARFDIEGGTCGDLCCACCCGPCVNCQMANELDHHHK